MIYMYKYGRARFHSRYINPWRCVLDSEPHINKPGVKHWLFFYQEGSKTSRYLKRWLDDSPLVRVSSCPDCAERPASLILVTYFRIDGLPKATHWECLKLRYRESLQTDSRSGPWRSRPHWRISYLSSEWADMAQSATNWKGGEAHGFWKKSCD